MGPRKRGVSRGMGIGGKTGGGPSTSSRRSSKRDSSFEDEGNLETANGGGGPLRKEEQSEEYKTLMDRRAHLSKTQSILEKFSGVVKQMENNNREQLVWSQYMKCDGLPDPLCVRELNNYLSLWKGDKREEIAEVFNRTTEVIPIMSILENFDPEEWESPDEIAKPNHTSKVVERNKIFDAMKSLQLSKLNRATYNLLLDVSPMVDPENNVLQHFAASELVQLGLWGNVAAKNMRIKGTQFESLGFGFELPAELIGNIFAVRVMRVEYDHYSKICRSNQIPPRAEKDKPTYIQQIEDKIKKIEEETIQRREEKKALKQAFEEQQKALEEAEKERQRLIVLERKNKKKGGILIQPGGSTGGTGGKLSEAEELLAEKTQMLQKQQQELLKKEKEMLMHHNEDAEEMADVKDEGGQKEEKNVESNQDKKKEKDPQLIQKELYKIDIQEYELNLRRNIILGGVFYFDMLEIPPQPKKVGQWVICQLETPQILKMVSWKADYKPPSDQTDENTITKKTPEEIEREIKLQEMELQKLVLVELKLPASSLWFEPPTIVRWEKDKKYWSTEGFYDTKFDEGKQTLTFRTISFGIFALSAFRFSNLPLQSWEMTPMDANKALVTLSAAAVQAEFEIGEGTLHELDFEGFLYK